MSGSTLTGAMVVLSRRSRYGSTRLQPVHVDGALHDLDRVAGQADDPFDEIALRVSRRAEDDDLASHGRVEEVPAGRIRLSLVERERVEDLRWIELKIDELVDDQVLVLVQRRLHARPLDLVVLDADVQHHEYQQGEDDSLERLSNEHAKGWGEPGARQH